MSAAAAALSTGVAMLSIIYALRLEPVTAGGRFAPDLTPGARAWVLAIGGVTAAVAAMAAWAFLPPYLPSVPVIMAAALAPTLALADHRALVLPLGIIGLLTLTALGTFTIDATLRDTWDRTGPGMLGAATITLMAALFWWPNRHRFGSGDVALISACACFLGRHGWAEALWGTAIVTLMGACRAIIHRLHQRGTGQVMPVGPALITGWWLAETLLITS